MTAPLTPTAIVCRDGIVFHVRERAPRRIVVSAGFRDCATDACGLGRYQTAHAAGDPYADHEGMPVDVVRAFAKAHGGVEAAGETALALLKKPPSAAEPAPAPEASPAVEEAAAPHPFLGEPWWTGGPRPRLCPGHLISLSWSRRLACGSTR